MSNNRYSKSQVADSAKQLIAGAAKHLTAGMQIPILGSSFTPGEVTSKLQMLVDLRADVDASKASTKAKVENEAAQTVTLKPFKKAFESYVQAAFGSSSDVLADFGITSKSRAASTVETKAAGVAKRAATRAARHTMGPKQKLGVKGDVTGVVMTPVTATAPVATPAPSGPTTPVTNGSPTAASNPATPAASTGPAVAATPHTA